MPRPTVFLGLILILVATMSVTLPAQAVPKNPWVSCFGVVGIDPHGMIHEAYFYREPAAKRLAASWVAAGWISVTINPC